MLRADCLTISFPGSESRPAVRDISFELEHGRTLAIVGESGSGKSLTALAMMGLLPKEAQVSGKIFLQTDTQQEELTALGSDRNWKHIRGNAIGMVFQEPMSSLNPLMKVGHQIEECVLAHQKCSVSESRARVYDGLKKVQLQHPEKMFERFPHQLSGGQKQRVMIAMAMCNHPQLLIADEPTTALDVTVQQEVVKLMKTLQEQTGTAMIFITHDLALAATIATDVLVMYRGEAVEQGDAMEIFRQPKHAYTRALLASKPSPEYKGRPLPTVSDFLDSSPSESPSVKPVQFTSSIKSAEGPLLEVSDLSIGFTERTDWLGRPTHVYKAVDDVSFQLQPGEILGLVGESGCGKSTLSKALMGLVPLKEGTIKYRGQDISGLGAQGWRQLCRQIQMIFQDPFASLNPRMNVGDMLAEPLRVHHIVPRREVPREVARLLDVVHLPADSIGRYPHQFSGGQRQRLGIARALAMRPALLICDESVSALDVSVQAQILNLLKELQYEFQLSYLFISHDLSVVHYIADRVLVMQQGKIVEAGAAADVLTHPRHHYTRRLIEAMPGL